MPTRYSIRLSPADARALYARLEAERPTVAAALTEGEREAFLDDQVHTPEGAMSIDLELFEKVTGIKLPTVDSLKRVVRQMRRSLPSAQVWMNGLAGRYIINEELRVQA